MMALICWRTACRRTLLFALFLGMAAATSSFGAIPTFVEKPATWKSRLVDKDGVGITDSEVAQWIKAEQDEFDKHAPEPFPIICTFTQCFSGGFVSEVKKLSTRFGANSCGRYFETCAYNDGALPVNSYYAFEWQTASGVKTRTDMVITDTAYNAQPAAIRRSALAQYQSAGAPPPMTLDAKNNRYAILFAGKPRINDGHDVNQIYGKLTGIYLYPAANIRVLFGTGAGDPNIPGGAAWAGAAIAASKANLQSAFNTWLRGKLGAINTDDAIVFFWTGDHGNVDVPISFSVDPGSVGLPGTDVRTRSGHAPPDPHNAVYEGGSGTNDFLWELGAPLRDVDALSDGRDVIALPLGGLGSQGNYEGTPLYFSVDRSSVGELFSGVAAEIARGGKVAPDVFAAAGVSSNRQFIDGNPTLGLQDGAAVPPPSEDELNALELSSLKTLVKDGSLKAGETLYFSVQGSADVDSITGAGPPANYVQAGDLVHFVGEAMDRPDPLEVDAIAVFDPEMDQQFGPDDQMLFSVGPQPPWVPCEIYVLTKTVGPPAVFETHLYADCDRIGLSNPPDNVDALDVLRGNHNDDQGSPQKHTIDGTTHSSSVGVLPFVTVQLLSPEDVVLAEVDASDAGAFAFEDLFQGIYQVALSDPECQFLPTTVEVENDVTGLSVVCVPSPIPTLSEWGLVTMILLMLAAVMVILAGRSPSERRS